ncbi:phosphotransferase [Streptomyces lancefieldiae]|uniref:Phosphotransferase n=1 Tax=Streptomyces lancefieldiae TaxID=3075520 RepID=A0ABU3B078_9ACTN|nr:phosphotransferase [Streptomyces sp. DSM 40712]MDT0615850.1 phosphotransferase [Streptomyces sp. DSM 40712]
MLGTLCPFSRSRSTVSVACRGQRALPVGASAWSAQHREAYSNGQGASTNLFADTARTEPGQGQFQGWRRLAAAFAEGADVLAWLDPWARRNLGRLADREAARITAAAGSALIHGDLRADNVLLTDDRVMVVDWPWAAVGASWCDIVLMGPSVITQGTPDAMRLPDQHLFARAANPDDVTSVLIAVTGYFLRQSIHTPPPGLPAVRGFQRAQGEAALDWVRERTRWRW